MSMLSLTAAERLDGPGYGSGYDADLRAASSPPGLAEASQFFFDFAGVPLVLPESALGPGQGA